MKTAPRVSLPIQTEDHCSRLCGFQQSVYLFKNIPSFSGKLANKVRYGKVLRRKRRNIHQKRKLNDLFICQAFHLCFGLFFKFQSTNLISVQFRDTKGIKDDKSKLFFKQYLYRPSKMAANEANKRGLFLFLFRGDFILYVHC